MPLDLETVPCLSDNYAFVIHDAASGDTAVVDVPEAEPVEALLEARGWRLTDIIITHHHPDHVGGVARLRKTYDARVTGAAADRHRLPNLDREVRPGDWLVVCGEDVHILDVSGHTVGHIALHLPEARLAFTGDSLMALGCGRLFEGEPEQMWKSLSQFHDMDPETLICSGHEYTQNNARFALSVDGGNEALRERAEAVEAARAEGQPTVPSKLADELATNPFLRANEADLKSALGMGSMPDAEVFAEIRRRKDAF